MIKLFLPVVCHAQWRIWLGVGYNASYETITSEFWQTEQPDYFDAAHIENGHGFVRETGIQRDLGRWFTVRASVGLSWRRITGDAEGHYFFGTPDSVGLRQSARFDSEYEFRRTESVSGLNLSFVAVRTKRFGCGISGIVQLGFTLLDRFRFRTPNQMNTAISSKLGTDFIPYNTDWYSFSSPPDLFMRLGIGLFFAYDLTDRLRLRLDGHSGRMGIPGQNPDSQAYGGGYFQLVPSISYLLKTD